MKPEEQWPIEPLSEASWQRIERSVLTQAAEPKPPADRTRRAARRWRVALLAAAAVQVAAAAVFVWMRPNVQEPRTLASTRLAASGTATETMLGDVSVRVEPEGALVHVENSAGALVVLERGAAQFSVPPRRERPAFVVQAGAVRVEVVGTRFRVDRSGGSVRVDAYEGKVRVVAGERSELLTAGASFRHAESAVPAAPATLAPSKAEPTPVESTPPEAMEPRGRTAPGMPSASPGASKSAGPSAHREAPPREMVTGDPAARRFERAARLEASEPKEALRLYGELAAADGPWAEIALYAMGRLALERGEEAHAKRLLQRYLERYPAGANAADVRALLAR